MAKPLTKAQKDAAAAVKAAPTPSATALLLLAALVTVSADPAGYMFVSAADAAELVTAGLAVQNPSMPNPTDPTQIATRATEAGAVVSAQAQAAALASAPASAAAPGTPAGFFPPAAAPAPAATAKPVFKIVSAIPVPAARRAGARSGGYPFDALEVGQAFFIPATKERPNPAKSYASTVATAVERYAVATGKTRVTRKGNTVQETQKTRDFVIRGVPDGAAFGDEYKGVAGAGVWRMA